MLLVKRIPWRHQQRNQAFVGAETVELLHQHQNLHQRTQEFPATGAKIT